MHRTTLYSIAAIVGLATSSGRAALQNQFLQSQAQFRAAFENKSTSPSFVLVTVVDGRSGMKRAGCTLAGFLLTAIAKENGFDHRDYHGRMLPDVGAWAIAQALGSNDHTYTFFKPDALAAIPTEVRGSAQACRIIRSGVPAYMQDRTGQIRAGQP